MATASGAPTLLAPRWRLGARLAVAVLAAAAAHFLLWPLTAGLAAGGSGLPLLYLRIAGSLATAGTAAACTLAAVAGCWPHADAALAGSDGGGEGQATGLPTVASAALGAGKRGAGVAPRPAEPAAAPPCVAACLGLQAAPPCDAVDVWVLAGQSNTVGWNQADGQPMPLAAMPLPGRILAWRQQCGAWRDAVPNVHVGVWGYEDRDSCGPDMAFARTLISRGAAHKVGLVPTAMGGTNLYGQWRPGGQLWSNMVAQTRAALTQLGPAGRLRGMLWVQGEADAAGTPEQAFAYAANFDRFLAATRAALAPLHPRLPVLMVVMSTRRRHQAFPYIDVVAAQQAALELPGLAKMPMEGFEMYPDEAGQLVHLTKGGCCALGTALGHQAASAGVGGVGGGGGPS